MNFDLRLFARGVERTSGMNRTVAICRAVLAVSAAFVLVGCGSENPFDHVQIRGAVTYQDGSPIPGHRVQVTFIPQRDPLDAKTHPKNGYTDLGSEGQTGIITSYKYGDGVVRGKHKVVVLSLTAEDTPTSAVPKEYWSEQTTPLEIDTADSPFELKVRRPTPK